MNSKISLILLLLVSIFIKTNGQGIIVDHNCTDITIPSNVIDSVFDKCKFQWAATSHGHQLLLGLKELELDSPNLNVEIGDGEAGSDIGGFLPDVSDALCIMDGITLVWAACGQCCLGINPEGYWQGDIGNQSLAKTIDCYPAINISGWGWCTELNIWTALQVQEYLDQMNAYELQYPDVRFIYATGTAQYGGAEGYNRFLRNNEIRQYCADNDKILYDFADLDSWSNGDLSYYEYNGEIIPLQHSDYTGDIYHTNLEGMINKAKAVWYMMARITGWEPGMVTIKKNDLSEWDKDKIDIKIVPNPFISRTEIRFILPDDTKATVEIYDLQGRKIETLFDDYVIANQENIVIFKKSNSIQSKHLLCIIRTPLDIFTRPLVSR